MDSTATEILEALKNYRCQYTQDEHGEGIPLVDLITPEIDTDIARGQMEMELLAEHIADELFHRNRG